MATLEQMTSGGTLHADELARMLVPIYDRTLEELQAPFADPELGLELEEARLDHVADPIWEAYCAGGDPNALAEGYCGFVRAAFGPTLVAAMDQDRPADRRREFLSGLDAGLTRRILAEPAALCAPTVATLLIVKPAARP
jgi:hypothetical protein